jgi:chromosome segregation ATPase
LQAASVGDQERVRSLEHQLRDAEARAQASPRRKTLQELDQARSELMVVKEDRFNANQALITATEEIAQLKAQVAKLSAQIEQRGGSQKDKAPRGESAKNEPAVGKE